MDNLSQTDVISGHLEQLGPCGYTSHFVNTRHSRVKTQGASCIGDLGQTDGRRKFELGIPQSRGAPYIRNESYIRDKTVIYNLHMWWVISKWTYGQTDADNNDTPSAWKAKGEKTACRTENGLTGYCPVTRWSEIVNPLNMLNAN